MPAQQTASSKLYFENVCDSTTFRQILANIFGLSHEKSRTLTFRPVRQNPFGHSIIMPVDCMSKLCSCFEKSQQQHNLASNGNSLSIDSVKMRCQNSAALSHHLTSEMCAIHNSQNCVSCVCVFALLFGVNFENIWVISHYIRFSISFFFLPRGISIMA